MGYIFWVDALVYLNDIFVSLDFVFRYRSWNYTQVFVILNLQRADSFFKKLSMLQI